MHPLDALNEIATLLERERASRYRSKAFRTAARAIEGVGDEELRDAAALRRRRGVGDSSFAVIQEALRGEVPQYLADLRAKAGVSKKSALRSHLRGDLHCHSDWSDGLTSIDLMVDAARALGHEYLALTDHSPRLRVANGLSPERLRDQLAVVKEMSGDGFTLLSGIEVDILDDGSLDQEEHLLDELDVVVASAHSKLRMESGPMTRRLVAAASGPHIDVLGHVTGRLVEGARGTRPPSTFDAAAVFEACASNAVAVEINSRPERQDPPDDLIALALEAGCLFAIDSDAHAPGQLALLDYGAARAERAGIPASRIVTTWPLERLREWTSRPRGERWDAAP
ncbi:PHP domain-containing protein [Microbacterium sp. C7(2022)]|uniref:PHP domain-containing protein n=1 Tax=Microbacterium sp. C7(2022) TaxID=2992759 RepID=UPI00237BD645|nr:PHP domain-containing protein [Microbacterium sp. C7(2022)]MDE0546782.1 PHP domain-containing protein [Microbacterium sp. C7(2022)]